MSVTFAHLGNRPLISLSKEECMLLFINLDMEIASNEEFRVNGSKLYYCKTWKDIQDLQEMCLPEAKALMHNIRIYKKEGVPVHLLDAGGIMKLHMCLPHMCYL